LQLRRFVVLSDDPSRDHDFLAILGMTPSAQGRGWTGFALHRERETDLPPPIVEVVSRAPFSGFSSAPGFQVSPSEFAQVYLQLAQEGFEVTDLSGASPSKYFFARDGSGRAWQFFSSF
jgi:hypothetical protein